MRLTQTGTLALLLSIGCGESRSDDVRPEDGSPSDQEGDAGALDACEAQEKREAAFLTNPPNVRCDVNDDCVTVGDCSNARFLAVNGSVEAAAAELIDARPSNCRDKDGPGFHAICSSGTCVAAEASLWCGQPEDRRCPEGMHYVEPGCGAEPFPAGCYFDCGVEPGPGCPTGSECVGVSANPCLDEQGHATCDLCASNTGVCQPTCDVSLSLSLDARPTATIPSKGAVRLRAAITNRTNAPVTFSYDAPCYGPAIRGLDAYHLWNTCLSGACEDGFDGSRVTVTLAPGQTQLLGEEVVTSYVTTCNANGLDEGSYTLGWSLSNVEGASVCAAEPVTLTVGHP